MKHLALLIGVLALSWFGCLAAAKPLRAVPELRITIEGRAEHPIVYITKADIARARRNRETRPWAKAVAESLLAEADRWTRYSDDELRRLLPGPGACFAEGFSGCPICQGKIELRGVSGAASLDDPCHVKCVNGHRLPDQAHPDDGGGWTDSGGKKFFFVGTYNAFVSEQVTSALTMLAHAYALTGERVYAEKAAVMMDALARIYPTCDKGSWDWPQDPLSGRLNRPLYQVARTLVLYANQYDILMMGDALNSPSVVAGKSKRQNIEENLLLDGAKYCYEWSVRYGLLTNGQADYERGAMAVGAAMGIPQYIAHGVDGAFGIRNMLENNIDRDGQYYETSSNYSRWTRTLYMDIAEILRNYRDRAYPDGIQLADHPKFRALFTLPQTRMEAAGVTPPLGDDPPNIKPLSKDEAQDLQAGTDFTLLQHLYALKNDPNTERLLVDFARANKSDVEELLARQALGSAGTAGVTRSPVSAGAQAWFLFHASEPTDLAAEAARQSDLTNPLTGRSTTDSDLLAQRGFAILRSVASTRPCALTFRFGPTLNHGHYDSMNLGLFLDGQDLTYDMGYGLSTMHSVNGFARLTAAHNLVLVDEKNQLQEGPGGGTVQHFVRSQGLRAISADDARCYSSQKVLRYQRSVMMIDTPSGESYALDVFRVAGGKQHDYIFHSQAPGFSTSGLKLSPPRKGSLAGPEIDWGAHLGVDGDVLGHPNQPAWIPPPGNGLGFLLSPRTARPKGDWSAQWSLPSGAKLRLTMAPTPDVEVLHCDAPGVYPSYPRAAYIVARRASVPQGSTFASILEPYQERSSMGRITWLASPPDAAGGPVAVKVELGDGACDYLLDGDTQPIRACDGTRAVETGAGQCRARFDRDSVVALDVIGGESAVAADVKVKLDRASYDGVIERADHEKRILYTRLRLPEGEILSGQFLYVGSAADAPIAYSQQSPYRISSVRREGELTAIHLAPTTFIIGRAHLSANPPDAHTLPNVVPLEFAQSLGHKASGFYRGKLATSADGATKTIIRDIDATATTIRVESSAGFKANDDVYIHDLRSGDTIRIPCFASLRRDSSGAWRFSGNVAGTLESAAVKTQFQPASVFDTLEGR